MDLKHAASLAYLAKAPCPINVFEPDVQDAFGALIRGGDVVYDIGANLGWFSLQAIEAGAGRVYAFEPQPRLAELLSLTLGRLPNAHLFQCALADVTGTLEFFVPDDHTMGSLRDWTVPYLRGPDNPPIQVPTERLDSLGLPHPDLIKIDVEGAELLVFRGARDILDRPDAPIIMFESAARSARAFGDHMFDARDYLLSLPRARYSVQYLYREGWKTQPPDQDFVLCLATPGARGSSNL